MDYLDLKSGGFGLTIEGFKFLQKSLQYGIIGLSKAIGKSVILEGVVVTAGNVSAGTIIYNGEIFPFKASVEATTITIIETNVAAVYNEDLDLDGNLDTKPAHIIREAKCGTGGVITFSFSELKRISKLQNHSTPIGGIIMWSGSINTIPNGWKLCNGSNGTPNLSGRFIVGFDSSSPDYSDISTYINRTGGFEKVKLSESQMPSHNHNGNIIIPPHKHSLPHTVYAKGGSSSQNVLTNNNNINALSVSETTYSPQQSVSLSTINKGGNEDHENRPPYYVVAYIIYVG